MSASSASDRYQITSRGHDARGSRCKVWTIAILPQNKLTAALLVKWDGKVKGLIMRTATHLPKRFPVGTKYVLEGSGGIVRRYIELPNGRRIKLEFRNRRLRLRHQRASELVSPR